MTAIPSGDSPIGVLSPGRPSPYATENHPRFRTVWPAWRACRSCNAINQTPSPSERKYRIWIYTYRTVRASSSIGAPDRTAAGRTSPGSLPSITRFGTGVNVLARDQQEPNGFSKLLDYLTKLPYRNERHNRAHCEVETA